MFFPLMLMLVIVFVNRVFKASARLNNLIILGVLCVYVEVILFGLDGQFFAFNDSSLGCCYVCIHVF